MAESKHQQLVNSICTATVAALQPCLTMFKQELSAEFADVNVMVNGLVARLEILETRGIPPGGVKRLPRGERKTGEAAAKKPTADDPLDRIKNAMLFCRRMWADPQFRNRYTNKDVTAGIEVDDKISKLPKDSPERYLAEGSLVWRKFLTSQQKKDMRDEFSRWRDSRDKETLEDPLDADDAVDDGVGEFGGVPYETPQFYCPHD